MSNADRKGLLRPDARDRIYAHINPDPSIVMALLFFASLLDLISLLDYATEDHSNIYVAAHCHPKGPGDARPIALQIIKDEKLVFALPDLVILIKGCSSGLGVETVRALAATDATLFLTPHNLPKSQEALGAELVSKSKDPPPRIEPRLTR